MLTLAPMTFATTRLPVVRSVSPVPSLMRKKTFPVPFAATVMPGNIVSVAALGSRFAACTPLATNSLAVKRIFALLATISALTKIERPACAVSATVFVRFKGSTNLMSLFACSVTVPLVTPLMVAGLTVWSTAGVSVN